MLKFRIIFTISKLMAVIVFITCAAYSFYTKDSSVIIMAVPITSAALGWKSYLDSKNKEENV